VVILNAAVHRSRDFRDCHECGRLVGKGEQYLSFFGASDFLSDPMRQCILHLRHLHGKRVDSKISEALRKAGVPFKVENDYFVMETEQG